MVEEGDGREGPGGWVSQPASGGDKQTKPTKERKKTHKLKQITK